MQSKPLNEALEQMEAAACQVAMVVASYYETLKKNGVPDYVAKELTLEFQERFLMVFFSKQ
jgi:hypothetical protein